VTPIKRVLAALEERDCAPKRCGNGWSARCPSHDDRTPSLCIGEGEEGRVLLKCHAGCDYPDVLRALGLSERDLFSAASPHINGVATRAGAPPPPRPADAPDFDRIARDCVARLDDAALAELGERLGVAASSLRELSFGATQDGAFTWPERNGRGGVVGIGQRNQSGKKRCIPRSRRGLIFSTALSVDADRPLLIVEGASDCAAGMTLGLRCVGLAQAGGSTQALGWLRELLEDLRPPSVIVIGDADEAGKRGAAKVAELLADRMDCPIRLAPTPSGAPDLRELLGEAIDRGLTLDDADSCAKLGDQVMAELTQARVVGKPTPAKPVAAMRRLSDIEPEPVEWLWKDRIAIGRLTLIAGDPGLGKSLLTTDLAARCSMGGAWPDGEPNLLGSRGVVIASAEDSAADTIRPRFDAAGGDSLKVMILDGVRRVIDGKPGVTPWSISDGMALRDAIAAAADCVLVIVDPVSAYMPAGLDSHRNTDVRGALRLLSQIAEETGVAIVAVTHLRKGEGAAIYRAMGSLAFVAAARAAFGVIRDPNDETGETRLVAPIKNNLAPPGKTLPFTTVKSPDAAAPVVVWGEPCDRNIDEELAAGRNGRRSPNRRDDAVRWLAEMLDNGPLMVSDLRDEAKAAGFAWRTVERAKEELGVESMKKGFANAGWHWRLPASHEDRHGDGQGPDVGGLRLVAPTEP
jgi:RecA/RadA recombinase